MNRHELMQLLHQELSGERCLESAAHMTQFYRSPGASGYHRATDYSADLFRGTNVDKVWAERYPLDGESASLAWEPISAELRINSPSGKLLVSYEDSPSCIPWWTPSTPSGGVTLDLVDVGTGEHVEDYQKQDVKGKVVLIRSTERANGWGHSATLAMDHGAAGIITDYLLYQTAPFRTRESLPDPVMLLRMPPRRDCWAIVVNYHAAEQLASLAAQGGAKVFVDIQAKTFKGEGQNLFADITGTDKADEYIQFVCHATAGTKPGANCASGPALSVEMARTISDLIATGRIPRPRRTIRFLINIEGQGTKHYASNHPDEFKSTITTIALDSVGHDQRKSKSALLFYRSPDSLPTFVNDFYESLMEVTPKETRWVFHNSQSIPFVNFVDHPYCPWSDNSSIPFYGVPSPLLMSWPDLYFHTDHLTAENLDPDVFKRCGVTTALAALELANAGPDEVPDIMRVVGTRSQARLSQIALNAVDADEKPRIRKRLAHLAKRDQEAIESALRLLDSNEIKQHPEIEATMNDMKAEIQDSLEKTVGWIQGGGPEPDEFPAGDVVPKRAVDRRVPLSGVDYLDLMTMAEEMEARDPKVRFDSLRIIGDELWMFVDGKRTVNQISDAIGAEFDFDLDPRQILKIVQGMAEEGLLTLG